MRRNIFIVLLVMFGLIFLALNSTNAYSGDYVLIGSANYSCDFEAANPCISDWTVDIPWDITTEDSHSGTQSMTDSPGADYAGDIDVSLTLNTSINLVSATNPQLKFWHRYELESEYDYGYVEVSTDSGITWYYLAYFTGVSGWTREQIDLSDYIGYSIQIRFRLITDGSEVMDGWYIDDVSVTENTASLSYPFFDDAEASSDNWIPSTWGRTSASSAHSGLYSWTDSPGGSYAGSTYTSLVLSGTLNFSTSVNPQLSFWHRFPYMGNLYRVFVSNNSGHNWTQLASYAWSEVSTWTRVQLDLSAYKGLSNILIKFEIQPYSTPYSDGWYIDDVMVAEASADIKVVAPASKDFGNIDVGSQSAPQVFTVTNKGMADLVISTLSLTGANASEFIKQNDNCSGMTLASFVSCTVEVVFSPTSAGPKSANLSIPSNDPDTPNLNVPLNGTGISGSIDLIISSLSAPSKAKAGQTISISDTTKNIGAGTAGASNTKFYLSVNSKWDTSDIELGSRAVPSLAKGASSSGATSVTIPSGTTAGAYYIIAVADADKSVAESNEKNNSRSKSIVITAP